MSETSYLPPYRRVLSQAAIRALLLVQLLTYLVFVPYMPNWFLLVFVLVIFWRWRVLRGQLRKPPFWMVLPVLAAGIAGIAASGFNRYSLDSAVAFCLLGYFMKSLEVLRRRDGIFQIYLGLFLSGVYLLYRFDPLGALFLILLMLANLIALQAVTSDLHFRLSYALKQSTILIVAAIPIMIAGYLFFPRIPPLWNIPNDERGAQTGMSDELRPGSVAELAQSTAPAFRVRFDGPAPPRDQWYWRGNTLSRFDGETWRAEYNSRNAFAWPRNASLPAADSAVYDYTVILEKTGQQWLYFLDWPVQINAEQSRLLPDARSARVRPVNNVFRYSAVSAERVLWQQQQSTVKDNLALPSSGNQALRVWARDRYQQSASDQAFVDDLLSVIRQEDFYYTLRPSTYPGADSIQNFWLGERRGFCEHYASAVAFILRSVGIPARIVGGYLGGTYVPSGDYIQVRQLEAHAWVEAWIDDRWQRIDPTAAVAPNRVEMNLDELFLSSQPGDLSVGTRLGQLALINRFTMFWDSMNYQWQVMVLNYSTDQAANWFSSSFGGYSPMKVVLVLLALMALIGVLIALSLGLIPIPKPRSEPYRTLNRLYRWYGPRSEGETVRRYGDRLLANHPSHLALVPLTELIEQCLYDPNTDLDRHKLRQIWQSLRQQQSRR